MATQEFILSDVHSNTYDEEQFATVQVSTFHYVIPPPMTLLDTPSVKNDTPSATPSLNPIYDEDGDYDIPRLNQSEINHTLFIEHRLATPLSLVGTQLWNGSFLLADYIIQYNQQFKDSVVIELGCGIGLVGIIASSYVNHIYCTDFDIDVLKLCEKNILRNCPHIEAADVVSNVSVRQLNWKDPTIDICSIGNAGMFSWNDKDMKLLKNASYIIAADVIYDDELSDVFLSTLSYLVTSILDTSPTILIATERRIVFTLAALESRSPSHDHFMMTSQSLYSDRFTVEILPIEFGQFFQDYERTKELELWKICILPS